MKAVLLTFLFALFAALTSAQLTKFYVTYPITGNVVKAGEELTIKWFNGVDQTVEIRLISGTSANTLAPTTTSVTAQGLSGSATLTLPADLDPSLIYAFDFQYKGANGETLISYSDPFEVAPGSPGSKPKSTATTTTATPKETETPKEPKQEEPKQEEPKAEEPKAEEPKAKEPEAEEPKSASPNTKPESQEEGDDDEGAATRLKMSGLLMAIPAVMFALAA